MYTIVGYENRVVSIKDTNDGVVEKYTESQLPTISKLVNIRGYENGRIVVVKSDKDMISLFRCQDYANFLNHFTSDHVAEIRYSIKGGMFINNYVYTLRKSWGDGLFAWADHDSSKRRREYHYEDMLDVLSSIPSNASCTIKLE